MRWTSQASNRLLNRPLLAPLWHTVLLVGLFLAVAATGAFLHRGGQPAPPERQQILARYLPLVAVEWSLLLYVCLFRLSLLAALIGGRGFTQLGRDLLIGLCGFAVLQSIALAFPQAQAAGALLPSSHLQQAAWILVSLSAGFCEEVVFRGYLQRQFEALTGFKSIAIVLQAALFGLAHGYQGAAASLQIALVGAALGALASYCRSLRPGIACHVFTDLASGLLRG